MAESGESYSVAARELGAAGDAAALPGDAAAVREIIAAAESTLAAPSARIEFRADIDTVRAERPEPRRAGPVERLVRRAARAGWERIASDAATDPERR